MSSVLLDDCQDGDSIVTLPDFYTVRDSSYRFACDGVSFLVGRENEFGFFCDADLTNAMLDVFKWREKDAETMHEIAGWLRAQG